MYNLVKNEVLKMIAKKRLLIVFGILAIMISSFAYGQYSSMERTKSQLEKRIGVSATNDWRNVAEQRMIDLKNRLESPYISDERKATTRATVEQLKYYLDNNINPIELTGAGFTTKFIEMSMFLFLPLMVVLLTADLVSGELSAGTVKILLVQGVQRWKILLSKYISLLILTLILLLFAFIISVLVSGIFFGYGGWMLPVSTGFKVVAGQLITSGVVTVPQWQYAIMVYGLAYYVAITVGTISFMISSMVRSTAASIGVVLSTLIGGSLMNNFLTDWTLPRYFFMTNLRLGEYISGSLRPIEGMDMMFSITVLACWIVGSLIVSFSYFQRRDILV